MSADNPEFLDSLRRRANSRNVRFRISLRWPIHIINSVDKTKLSCNTPHRRSTTVSFETYPLSFMSCSKRDSTSSLVIGRFGVTRESARNVSDILAISAIFGLFYPTMSTEQDKDYCHDEDALLRDDMESTNAAENTEKTKNSSDSLAAIIANINQIRPWRRWR